MKTLGTLILKTVVVTITVVVTLVGLGFAAHACIDGFDKVTDNLTATLVDQDTATEVNVQPDMIW